ncbi:MAG: C40 family peptidase [Rhodospirillaceae bacterium]|nr:C40 family peptidase [Rhodospirillaceae bacterium]
MEPLDRRFHPIRADLAAAYLVDRIDAPRYADGVRQQVIQGALALRRAPRDDAPLDTELLYGEFVTVYDAADGWAWLQNEADRYVGYARAPGLTTNIHQPTHSVRAVATFIYPEPDIKTPPLNRLGMGARIAVIKQSGEQSGEQSGPFSRSASGGWIFDNHLASIEDHATDHAAVALQFLGVPYLWGGKTSLGLDCSGLVQVALDRCGVCAPRDTDIQACELGASLGSASIEGAISGDFSDLRRGDLVFWPGHVGVYADSDTFVHANATDMAVATAPLQTVSSGVLAATGDKITDIRRL